MKIAFLSFYSGLVYRGVETFVHELANRLVDSGNEIVVFQTGHELKGARYKTITINVPCDLQKRNSYIPYLNYYARKVKKFTNEALRNLDQNTDIVIPTNGQWQSLLCKLWARNRRKKIVIAGQSGPGLDDRLNLLTFPNAFVGLTDFQVAWAKRANPFVKSIKIPNGVDLSKFNEKVEKMVFDLPRPIILCVAALDLWKRNELIIKAVSNFSKGSLLLVGKGSEEKNLKVLGDKLLPGRFKILSFSHSEMPPVYKLADIFTYATVPWESFGIVLLEAMASGLPVVATDDPIRREIVGDAGLFVNPENTQEYAKTIDKALGLKWGDKPKKQAEKFSWDRIAQQYEGLFKTL